MKKVIGRGLMVLGALYLLEIGSYVARKIVAAKVGQPSPKFITPIPKNRFHDIPQLSGYNKLQDELNAVPPVTTGFGGYL